MKKNILKVYRGSYIASVWIPIFLTLTTIVVLFVLYDSSRNSLRSMVLSSIILFSASTYMIIYALYLIQRAEISEEGITFIRLFSQRSKQSNGMSFTM